MIPDRQTDIQPTTTQSSIVNPVTQHKLNHYNKLPDYFPVM